METWLCQKCGQRLDSSARVCPACGALNPHNAEVVAEATEQVIKETKSMHKFTNSFSVVALIIGIGLLIFHMIILVSGSSYSWGTAFVGAVSAGMVVVLTILGMTKNEGVGYAVLISGGISLWMLIMAKAF